MFRLLSILVLLSTVALTSYGASTQVTVTTLAAHRGILTDLYYDDSSAIATSAPNANTAQTSPGSSGTVSLNKGTKYFLWSPQFTSGDTIEAGTWRVILFASSARAGATFTVSVLTTNSGGTKQTTVINNVKTAAAGTSMGQLVLSTTYVKSVSVPASGYLEVIITPAQASTLYWGAAQLTSLQTPTATLSG
jgi:hypothetical protein